VPGRNIEAGDEGCGASGSVETRLQLAKVIILGKTRRLGGEAACILFNNRQTILFVVCAVRAFAV